MNFNKNRHIRAVILVGNRDFGRCPVASALNRALWPLFDQPALQSHINSFHKQGISHFSICCGTQNDDFQKELKLPEGISVTFLTESLPRGTAGCVKDAAGPDDEIFIIVPASLTKIPDIEYLLSEHQKGKSEITVFLNPSQNNELFLQPAHVYIFEKTVLEDIADTGYFDIKEGLIPRLVRSAKPVYAAILDKPAFIFRNWHEYLSTMQNYLCSMDDKTIQYNELQENSRFAGVWNSGSSEIADSARVIGPVVIGNNCRIEADAVIVGPSVIGTGSVIGPGAFVNESILWKDARIGANSHVDGCLVGHNRNVLPGVTASNKVLFSRDGMMPEVINRLNRLVVRYCRFIWEPAVTLGEYMHQKSARLSLLTFVILFFCLLGIYLEPTLRDLWHIWMSSDEYSSGLLVPFLGAFVIWHRRKELCKESVQPALLTGGLVLVISQAIRFFGLYYMFGSLDKISLALSLSGIILLLLGWRIWFRILSVMIFLFLMLPFPKQIESRLSQPLQEWSTASAVFVLETCGLNVIREGNVINLNGTLVGVAEACNGLRMLTAFIVVSAFVVLILRKSRVEKMIILVSSIPIALLCNTLRLAVTAIAFTQISSHQWQKAFHDYGGLAMMPLALLLVIGELWILARLFYEPRVEYQQPEGNIIYRKAKD